MRKPKSIHRPSPNKIVILKLVTGDCLIGEEVLGLSGIYSNMMYFRFPAVDEGTNDPIIMFSPFMLDIIIERNTVNINEQHILAVFEPNEKFINSYKDHMAKYEAALEKYSENSKLISLDDLIEAQQKALYQQEDPKNKLN